MVVEWSVGLKSLTDYKGLLAERTRNWRGLITTELKTIDVGT
jgi:hypothetical protein